jgi:hypothetical protein
MSVCMGGRSDGRSILMCPLSTGRSVDVLMCPSDSFLGHKRTVRRTVRVTFIRSDRPRNSTCQIPQTVRRTARPYERHITDRDGLLGGHANGVVDSALFVSRTSEKIVSKSYRPLFSAQFLSYRKIGRFAYRPFSNDHVIT